MNYPTKLAAVLLASSAAAPALASDWVPLGMQRDGTQVALSKASLERRGDTVNVLVRFTPQGAAAEWTTFVSVDCWSATIFAARVADDARRAPIRPRMVDYHLIQRNSTGGSIAAALCPASIPANIGLTSIGGGPAMVMPYDPR